MRPGATPSLTAETDLPPGGVGMASWERTPCRNEHGTAGQRPTLTCLGPADAVGETATVSAGAVTTMSHDGGSWRTPTQQVSAGTR